MSRRDVLADMKAGRFVCPIHGRGFFCRASNSLRVTAAAANAWRRSFFVPVELAGDPIASHKREIEPGDRSPISPATDQHGPNIRQRRAVVRRLSPSFLASK
jgi:hypothetical protein